MFKRIIPIALSVMLSVPQGVYGQITTQANSSGSKDVEVEVAKEGNTPFVMSLPEQDFKVQSVPQLQSPALPATYLPGDPTSVKDQQSEGLCWAYSAAKSMELSTYNNGFTTGTLSPIQFANTFYKSGAVDMFNLTSGDRVLNTSTSNGGNDLLSVFASMTQATPSTLQNGTYANVNQHPINAYFYNTGSVADVKQAIYDHGACTIAVKSRDNANGCWYETDSSYLEYNHAITLIGWQDSVSKSNFTSSSSGTPSNGGAFRFVNSWGTEAFGDQDGKGGYGWISYEDVTFTDETNNRALAYDVTKDWDVDNVYQNDGCYAFATRTTTRCAEVFSTHGGTSYEQVKGATVGLYSSGDYTAWVYRIQSTSEALTDQVLLGKQEFSMPAGLYGYTTVYFDDDIVINSGDTFAVAVTRTDGSSFKALVDLPATYSFVKFQPTSPANSYYFDETAYSTTDNTAPRIKVLTKDLTSTDHTGTMDDYRISLDYARLMYNGEPQYPTITIQDENGNLVDNSKFKFSYNNNINASKYAEVVVSSTDPTILGTQRLNFTIQPRPLDDAITTRNYTATANITYKTFLKTLYAAYNKKVLAYETDFNVTEPSTLLGYGDNQITLYGKGNFNSSVTIIVQGTGNGVAIDSLRASSFPNKIYTGKEIKLESNEYTIKYGTTTLTYGTDFRLTYSNNVNVGKAKVNFVGLGSYTGLTGEIGTFEIKALNVNDCVIQTPSSVAYMNQPVTLVPGSTITVMNADASQVIDSSNYTIDYTNNQGIGSMTAYVRGRNNLTGAVPCDVEIVQARMENAEVTVSSVDYTGSEVRPKVTVTLDGNALRENYDYTLRYTNNVKPGSATVTVLGQYYIQGYKEVNFTIKAPKMSASTVTGLNTSYYHTGTPIEPDIKVSIGEKELEKGTDYTLRFENNIDIGTAYIHVMGAGIYTGSKSVTFSILEDPNEVWHEYSPTLTSVSSDVMVKSKLSVDIPFTVTKVRVTNKKLVTAKKNGTIKTKGKTGTVTIEYYGAGETERIAYTLRIFKPTFNKKKYIVNVGDTIKLDDIMKHYNIIPSRYKGVKSKKATVDESKRTITFTGKGSMTLRLKYEGSSYKPKVKFKIKAGTVSGNK